MHQLDTFNQFVHHVDGLLHQSKYPNLAEQDSFMFKLEFESVQFQPKIKLFWIIRLELETIHDYLLFQVTLNQ